jgi:hypothetical protein
MALLAVWYSVDLPKGQDALRAPAHEQFPGAPQLYLLNVRRPNLDMQECSWVVEAASSNSEPC